MALLLGCLPRSSAVAVGLCAAYALVSMALALLNKALLSSYGFRAYFLLLVRPDAARAFDDVQELLTDKSISHGFDLIGADQSILHPERGAAP